MKLCIAEKPSVGKELARILGANNRHDGFFEGNGYYISWTFGHLCTLKAPDDYTPDWRKWNLYQLPIIPPKFQIKVMENAGIQKQFETIQTLIGKSDEIINCGDAGIEGELIQRWVLFKAQCTIPVKRLWISSLTDEAIREGFKNLKESSAYDLLYAAGNARAIGDWLLGMNASRLYTVKYANGKGVLSIGRVQTPTLALIVNRYHEIQNFVPETYWELKTTYRDVIFNSTKRKFTGKEDASKILDEIRNKEFEIVSSAKKKGNELPPALFDLTSLQVECNKKFNFTADETLKLIQKLYEQKLVTYPRVDTTYLPESHYDKIKGILKDMTPYAKYTQQLIDKPIKKSKKLFDDSKITDHHAIIPTGIVPGSGMNYQEKQVYDTIARRFIAAFYPDCVVSNTTVIGNVDEHEFSATGKVILEEGWRVLYPKKENDSQTDENQTMPVFVKGERGQHFPDLQEKQTQPPKMHTEATLLRAMETAGKQVDDAELRELMKENGIGRPSTRANIIETLFKRNYVTRQRKNLVPTVTGIELIHTIQNELLKSVELTGQWEKKLRQIEKGEYDSKVFLDEMKKMIHDLVLEVKNENRASITIEEEKKKENPADKTDASKAEKTTSPKTDKKEETLVCPKCKKGTIVKGKTAFGCNAFRDGCNFKVEFIQFEKLLTDKQLFTLIQKGKTVKIKGFTFNQTKINGIVKLDDSFLPVLEKDITNLTQPLICPKCNNGTMIKGRNAWGCSRFREGCTFLIPFDVMMNSYKTTDLSNDILKKVAGNK